MFQKLEHRKSSEIGSARFRRSDANERYCVGGLVELWGCLGSQEQKLALMEGVENVADTPEISDHISVTPHDLGGV